MSLKIPELHPISEHSDVYEVRSSFKGPVLGIQTCDIMLQETRIRHSARRWIEQYSPAQELFGSRIVDYTQIVVIGPDGDVIDEISEQVGYPTTEWRRVKICSAVTLSPKHRMGQLLLQDHSRWKMATIEMLVSRHVLSEVRHTIDVSKCQVLELRGDDVIVRLSDSKNGISYVLDFDRSSLPDSPVEVGDRLLYVIEKVGSELVGRFEEIDEPSVSQLELERINQEVDSLLSTNNDTFDVIY